MGYQLIYMKISAFFRYRNSARTATPRGVRARKAAVTATVAVMAWGMALNADAAGLTFTGNGKAPVSVEPDSRSGLAGVYVLRDTRGVTATYTAASSSASVNWKRFSTLGGGFAEDVAFTRNGAESSVQLTDTDMGYLIEEDGRQTAFWIVNYTDHICRLNALEVMPEADCTSAALRLDGDAARMNYYGINGDPREIDRGLTLSYHTQTYNEGAEGTLGSFDTVLTETDIPYTNGEIHCPAPLCDTQFTLTGDRFQQVWGEANSVTSATMQATAIDARAIAVQEQRDADNEQKTTADTGTLGGSAPVTIEFAAATSDAVIYREWQFARDAEFDLIDLRVNEDEVTQTFNEYGTTYVRFVAGNSAGTCDVSSETYTVNVGESRLECPNAFSPNDDGVNDEWKVSYKSIIDFDCHIFNRWGQELAHLTDPSQGWNGKYNGKTVPSGAYYYVITAKGADGRKYKLSGDINIINFKRSATGTGNTGEN